MKKQILLYFSFITLLGTVFFFILQEYSINDTKCEFGVHRFEQDFFTLNKDSFDLHFNDIKDKYPHFFSDTSLNVKYDVFLNDTLNEIFDSVQSVLKDELLPLDELQHGFCNYKKYFPRDTFSLYTYIEGTFDYRYAVVYSHEKLFVCLDLFLGRNHNFYNGFPSYIKNTFSIEYLPSSCYLTLANSYIPQIELDTFLFNLVTKLGLLSSLFIATNFSAWANTSSVRWVRERIPTKCASRSRSRSSGSGKDVLT